MHSDRWITATSRPAQRRLPRTGSVLAREGRKLEELAGRCEKVSRQIKQRVAVEQIKDRIVSLSDPDARPIRKGKLGKPNEFKYVARTA